MYRYIRSVNCSTKYVEDLDVINQQDLIKIGNSIKYNGQMKGTYSNWFPLGHELDLPVLLY